MCCWKKETKAKFVCFCGTETGALASGMLGMVCHRVQLASTLRWMNMFRGGKLDWDHWGGFIGL
jgi:hypothetical protein